MFEAHVTVRGLDINEFKKICDEFNCKVILIEFGPGMKDQLMNSLWAGCEDKCVDQANKFADKCVEMGGTVLRLKIEQLFSTATELTGDQYWEFHYSMLSNDRMIATKNLNDKLSPLIIKMSRSCLAKQHPGKERYILTLRLYFMLKKEAFTNSVLVKNILDKLPDMEVIKVASEKVVYDSNIELDNGWL